MSSSPMTGKGKCKYLLLLLLFTPGLKIEALHAIHNFSDLYDSQVSFPSTDTIGPEKKWTGSNTFISGYIWWKNAEGNKNYDFDLRFGTNLKSRLDEIELLLDTRFIVNPESPDNYKQDFLTNWYHTVYKGINISGQGRLERNQRTIINIDFDYMIFLGGVGPGYYFKNQNRGGSRISVFYNYIKVFVLNYDTSDHLYAPSIFLNNNYQLFEKLNFRNWTNVIFWQKGETGYEIESEIGYSISKNLTLGFRHYYLLNGPTLKHDNINELKLYTKINF